MVRGDPILAVAVALLVMACAGGPGPSHYAAVLDELAIPSDWELAKTEVRGPDGDVRCDPLVNAGCPAVVRYYLVDAAPIEVYVIAKKTVIDAGYEIQREFDSEACDAPPNAPACALFAAKEADQIIVNIYNMGQDDDTGVAQANRVTVRMTADKAPTD